MAKVKRDHILRGPIYTGSNVYIRPTYIVSIPQWHSDSGKARRVSARSMFNLENNRNNGEISKKAASKIKNSINWLCQSAKYKRVYDKKTGKNFYFKINFITLTIPLQSIIPSDKFIKEQIFHPWIVYARKYFGLKNYVWRVETQENGMIHFHLTADTFLHWRKIRSSWNRLLEKEGLLEEFKAKFGHADPNSTDVHAVKNITNIAAYLAKYLCKQDKERRKISGRLWGSNYELSHENKCIALCDPNEWSAETKKLFCNEIAEKAILGKPDFEGKQYQLGTLYLIKENNWNLLRGGMIYEAYNARRFEIRNNVAHLPPEYFSIN